jgi:hypothetical protein
MSRFDDPAFLAERDKWYARLKEEGFDDIEILDGNTHHPGAMLRGVSPGDLQRGLYKPETEEYYRCARHHVFRMKRGVGRQIWKLHSEGYAEHSIFKALEGRYPGLKLSLVKKTVKAERARMARLWDKQAEDDWLGQ